MSDSTVERLGSLYLEDMVIVTLAGRERAQPPDPYPNLDDERRARLRSRIKQVSRHDWPANRSEDPLIRRGYTLRQCCRLIVALMLIDAHLAPSLAIAIAKANEPAFLRLMVERMKAGGPRSEGAAENELVAVLLLGELAELVAEGVWRDVEPNRVRLIERSDIAGLWSNDDLASLGQRLLLDVGEAAAAAWRWITDRRLLTSVALHQLAQQLDGEGGPVYLNLPGVVRRR